MTLVGLLGDTHGNTNHTLFALTKFRENGITKVIQVGDFGLYQSQGSMLFLKAVNLEAVRSGITIYVTPGNHEDWTWLNSLFSSNYKVDDEGFITLRSNIKIAPRGLRWEWEGVSFVSLGGAPSVDRAWRRKMDALHPNAKNPLWDAGEAITLDDVQKVIAGGYADVMIGHDAPGGVPTIDHMINTPFSRNRWAFEDLLYAEDGRRLMTQAFSGVNPLTFIHGHYHFKVNDMIRRHDEDGRGGWTNVIGLDCDGSPYSLGAYGLHTKTAAIWKV